MEQKPKGLIHSINRAKQPIDFVGIKSKKIHPTDIDALIEIEGKYLFIFELKVKGNRPPFGQKLALERIAVKWVRDGGLAWIIYAEHDTPVDEPVLLKDCRIFEIWSKDKTILLKDDQNLLVKPFLKVLCKTHNITKLKDL
ncbi:hypothetical protein BPT24_046 [Tenacibaculum phage pT24]|uniref:Uncharacterized protein n=1 Tax=Tenacibaculum phage pT24 TaxID=1880590 RepID=A0A1B4XWI9_9CAUD|nr:hypothetical protein HYP10_gp046 [Tenacibaculum phage pT24]BAV39169.1 hypothetical protein BPT24_046 [Tenacibaculum phage pT24]